MLAGHGKVAIGAALDLSDPATTDEVSDLTLLAVAHFDWLEELDISGCFGVTEAGLGAVAAGLPKLRRFAARGLHFGTLVSAHVTKLNSVDELDVRGSTMLHTLGTQRMQATVLRAGAGHNHYFAVSMSQLSVHNFPRLRVLELRHVGTEVCTALSGIPSLEQLTLVKCSSISSSALGGIVTLKRLALREVNLHTATYFPARPRWAALVEVVTGMAELRQLELQHVYCSGAHTTCASSRASCARQ